MSEQITSLIERYAASYMAGDAEAIAAMCEDPFLAVRNGAAIHLADRGAIVAHFAANMAAYRAAGAASAEPLEIVVLEQGEVAVLATVSWVVRGSDGTPIRRFRTSYQLAGDPLRILAYVNHDPRPRVGP